MRKYQAVMAVRVGLSQLSSPHLERLERHICEGKPVELASGAVWAKDKG